MAQDQVKNILVIKIAWKLGMLKVFEKLQIYTTKNLKIIKLP